MQRTVYGDTTTSGTLPQKKNMTKWEKLIRLDDDKISQGYGFFIT